MRSTSAPRAATSAARVVATVVRPGAPVGPQTATMRARSGGSATGSDPPSPSSVMLRRSPLGLLVPAASAAPRGCHPPRLPSSPPRRWPRCSARGREAAACPSLAGTSRRSGATSSGSRPEAWSPGSAKRPLTSPWTVPAPESASNAAARSPAGASSGRRVVTPSCRKSRWAGSSSAGCSPTTRTTLSRRRATTSRSRPRRSKETRAICPTPASARERSSATSAQRRAIVTPGTRPSVVATDASHRGPSPVMTSVMPRHRRGSPRSRRSRRRARA